MSHYPQPCQRAFTLLELLLILSVVVIMTALVVPVFNSIRGAADLGAVAVEIKGALDQARIYAMANNTYVYVGIAEFNAALPTTASPQTPASSQAGGRVAVAVVATRSGERRYTILNANQGADWVANYGTGQHLVQPSKLQLFESIHLVKLNGAGASIPSRGGMSRPGIVDNEDILGGSSVSATPFTLPLGSGLAGGYNYRFDYVIQFSPEGVARVVTATNGDKTGRYLEIGLQQTRSNLIPPAPTDQSGGRLAAIQIDCITGKVRLYRP